MPLGKSINETSVLEFIGSLSFCYFFLTFVGAKFVNFAQKYKIE